MERGQRCDPGLPAYIEKNETSNQSNDNGGNDDGSENVNVHEPIIVACQRTENVVEDILFGR